MVDTLRYAQRRSRVRFPMVSLGFFIEIILPGALWPWGRLKLYQKREPRVSAWGEGVKAAGAYGWPHQLRVPTAYKFWGSQSPEALKTSPGLEWDSFNVR